MTTTYETVIGLEVHLQLATATKAFCGCPTTFGQRPNSQTCPVCLGFPGALPVLNEQAFLSAIKVALALGCAIQDVVKFDRKNYYYPDLPKNFQISQFDMPLAYSGALDIVVDGKPRRIRIRRVHLEEDAGKLVHPEHASYSLVDLNRTGIPLLEIVTEPDIASPAEAYEYLVKLKSVLEYLDVSDCDMEKGSLRCDANISLRPQGQTALGVKVEIKNMNSFKGVRGALLFEEKRQRDVLTEKGTIVQETRLWDAERETTISMRSKEEAHDYRYFPEPDLVPFVVDKKIVDRIRAKLPESPDVRAQRFVKQFTLSIYDAGVLTSEKALADYFEACVKCYANAKTVANWLAGEMSAHAKDRGVSVPALGVAPQALGALLALVERAEISGSTAKDVLVEMIETKNPPEEIVRTKGLAQVSDRGQLEEVIAEVIARNAKSVADYRSGKKNAFGFLVGQAMKETKGKANPTMINELLKKALGE